MASGGSSSGKGFGFGRGKGARKGPPIVWPGSIGLEFFSEAMYEFPVESRSDFTKDSPLRGYDNRIEDWPKCIHGEDCLVQMCAEGMDGGRRFFKCPRAWVMLSTKGVLDIFNMYCMIYIIFCVSGIQCSRELRVRTMGRSSPNSSSRRVHLLSAESYLRFRNGSKQRQQRRGGR